jgi:sugar phosphate isomerase/epimerase
MKFAICNEVFSGLHMAEAFSLIREFGYAGVEIAPFTLQPTLAPFDIRQVNAERIVLVRQQADDAGIEIVGLHWILATTDGLHLTSPDPTVRRRTADYLRALVELCANLGGRVMVLGSPLQRNLPSGVSHEDGEAYAEEVLHGVVAACAHYGVLLALEPLNQNECNFMTTAESAIHLAKHVSPRHCRVNLDVKAMCGESKPIPDIIRESREWLVHFHANDPNLLGPGMGDVDFKPIFAALKEVGYEGWVSVEPFKYEPTPEEVARRSIEYMRSIAGPN